MSQWIRIYTPLARKPSEARKAAAAYKVDQELERIETTRRESEQKQKLRQIARNIAKQHSAKSLPKQSKAYREALDRWAAIKAKQVLAAEKEAEVLKAKTYLSYSDRAQVARIVAIAKGAKLDFAGDVMR